MPAYRRSFRKLLAVVAVSCVAALGCDLRPFRVRIPGFDADAVQGLWIWRQPAEGGAFERFARIRFTERVQSAGGELQRYEVTWGGGGVTLQSAIQRSDAAPQEVTLNLAFQRAPGAFKVSCYNAAGESPLSEGTLFQ